MKISNAEQFASTVESQNKQNAIQLDPGDTDLIKVRFTQKILVKLSHCHSSEHFFAPGHLIPINDMNTSEKMSNFSFFLYLSN